MTIKREKNKTSTSKKGLFASLLLRVARLFYYTKEVGLDKAFNILLDSLKLFYKLPFYRYSTMEDAETTKNAPFEAVEEQNF